MRKAEVAGYVAALITIRCDATAQADLVFGA
jgi:hypothetical protein